MLDFAGLLLLREWFGSYESRAYSVRGWQGFRVQGLDEWPRA